MLTIMVVANTKRWTPVYTKLRNTLVIHQMDIPCDYFEEQANSWLVKLSRMEEPYTHTKGEVDPIFSVGKGWCVGGFLFGGVW